MKERNSYNLLLLGGTGARCGEIFVHMCANGYFEEKRVNILYIDSDQDNGNANSLRELINLYEKCREQYMIKESPIPCFFKTEICLTEANPVQGIDRFKRLAELEQPDKETLSATKALMRALYSDEECEMKISDGFFARPNVGAAVFAANMDQILEDFLKQIHKDQKDLMKIKIFMIGSVFGGTGASSFPTISKYLKQKLFGESTDKLIGDKLKIGGGMLLPYFSFTREKTLEKSSRDDIEIEADKFSTKTKSAIKYYKDVEKNDLRKIFDELYILGHDGYDIRGRYETAGSKQKNLPHMVEFYAAMAAVTFFDGNKEQCNGKYFAVVPREKIVWNQMYKNTRCFFSFLVMMRFSLVLKSLILEELFEGESSNWVVKRKAGEIPWYYDFLDGRRKSSDMEPGGLGSKFYAISRYCNKYVSWFAELLINDLDKQDFPDEIDFNHYKVEKNSLENEEEDDLVDYLDLFNDSLILKQYANILAENGLPRNYTKEKRESIKNRNIRYIRRHAAELSDRTLFGDKRCAEISFDDIWSRLNSFGFNSFVKTDNVFKNIEKANVRTMDEGVKNLINAIYVACMI